MLKARGGTLIAASAPPHFVEDTPTAVLVRQVLGAVAEFEKATLVAKLAAARRRKRIATGKKVEGRKSHAEKRPEIVALAKALARKKPVIGGGGGGRRSQGKLPYAMSRGRPKRGAWQVPATAPGIMHRAKPVADNRLPWEIEVARRC
jgi:hypothetical protein